MRWWMRLWPGLPELWLTGSLHGLLVAGGFAACVNYLLVGAFVWSGLLAPGMRVWAWAGLAGFSLTAAALSTLRETRNHGGERSIWDEDLFPQALDEYLHREWFAAEGTLRSLMQENPCDADARLMLCSVLRRSGRVVEASRELDRLEESAESGKWRYEIQSERRRLSMASKPDVEPVATTDMSVSVQPPARIAA